MLWIRRLTMALATALAVSAAEAQISEFAAKVNDTGISRARLQASVDATINERGISYGGITQPDFFKRIQTQVLDQLIAQELLWQEAQRKDFLVSDGDVALALEQVKKNYDSEQAFLNKIKEGGFNIESYTEDLKRQLSVRRLVTEGIAPATTVSDQEVEEFYTANPDKMQRPEELRARHILIKLAPDADPAAEQAAKAQIDKVLAEARAGADFAELATQHSQAPSAPQGGDLGFFGPGKMVPPFEQAAFALAPNEISEVVRTQFGYHIIRLEERRGGETLPKEAVAPQIRSYLTQQKVQQGVQDLVQDLRASGNVEVLLGN